MASYHFNQQTGLVGRCRAVRRCPFGDLTTEHYATPEEARQAYEATQSTLPKPALPWTTDMKVMDANDLAHEVLSRLQAEGAPVESYEEALELASFLHAKQRRRNRAGHASTPYIEHPLRSTLRLMRAGVKDPVVLKAMLLHDTVEDGAVFFTSSWQGQGQEEAEARRRLLSYLASTQGAETAEVVAGVTNELTPKETLSLAQKQAAYRSHVEEAITGSPRVLLVKLSDFVDNAGSLHHTDLPGKEGTTYRQATKYLPLVEVFRRELQKPNPYLPAPARDAFLDKLARTEERLQGLIAKYSSASPPQG